MAVICKADAAYGPNGVVIKAEKCAPPDHVDWKKGEGLLVIQNLHLTLGFDMIPSMLPQPCFDSRSRPPPDAVSGSMDVRLWQAN